MSETLQAKGYVTKLLVKEGVSKKNNKPYKLYSIRLQHADGEFDPLFYNFGFDKPPFKTDEDTDGHGDYVEFEATRKSDIAAEFVKGSGKIVKNAPARNSGKKPSGDNASGSTRAKTSDLFGSIGGYNTEDDVARMTYANARDHAIKVAELLYAMDALPDCGKGKDKGAQAKRNQEVLAVIDKLTVEYFHDSASRRKLESVADTPSQPSVAPLPDDVDEVEAEYEDSNVPPPDPDEDEAIGF